MAVTLTGSNFLQLKKRLDELMARFMAEQGELAIEKIDAAEADLQTVLDAVQSVPFLAQRKMVVLREPSSKKDISENIEQIISSCADSTDLVIYEPAPDKRTAYYKTLQKLSQLEQFAELDSPGLARWLVDEAAARGGKLSPRDAMYLIDRLGSDQQTLAGELEKLMLYRPEISRDTIELLTEAAPQGKIFELLDAAFGGNKRRALRLYDEQRAQKVEPQAIMAMLVWQLHLITLASLGKGRPPAQIASDAGIKPYPLNKAVALASKLDGKRLRMMVADLLKIDTQSKTTSLDLDDALKTYIATL